MVMLATPFVISVHVLNTALLNLNCSCIQAQTLLSSSCTCMLSTMNILLSIIRLDLLKSETQCHLIINMTTHGGTASIIIIMALL